MKLDSNAKPVVRQHTFDHRYEPMTIMVCTTCLAVEDALLDSCPGVPLTPEQQEWNQQGNSRRLKKLLRAGGL